MKNWDKIESYNVIYTVPGQTDRSAMPIGNGELCASVWMNEEGILQFYFGRTDCLLENDLTAKLGMVKIKTEPSFLSQGGFKQTLVLEQGKIEVESNLGKITFFISKETDTIYVCGEFKERVKTISEYITWRTKDDEMVRSPWTTGITRTADVVEIEKEQICFYHKNGNNGIKELATFEGVTDLTQVPDFLTGRIFGGILEVKNSTVAENKLEYEGQVFHMQITTLSGQYKDQLQWKEKILEAKRSNLAYELALLKTESYWKEFFSKSYIFVGGDSPAIATCTKDIWERAKETRECNSTPSQITRAYLLTKFMIACCKDGKFPICYNGFLFNLTPGNGEHLKVATFAGTYTSQPLEEANEEFNPDERSWDMDQLWQNLRLPYYTMLSTGDFESIRKMFDYYLRFKGVNEQRAKCYYGAQGQHNTEMTLTCGLQSGAIYGLDRKGKKPSDIDNSWGGSIEISPGLELLNLMLDYVDYTQDTEFLETSVIEYARGIFDYISTRFTKMLNGKIYLEDINSLEMFFHTDNPTPIIAGMLCTLEKLLLLNLSSEEREYFQQLLEKAPQIPTGIVDGEQLILPAEKYDGKRMNVETPELYTVYPFGIYKKMKGNAAIAINTFLSNTKSNNMMHPHIIGEAPGALGYSGWQYIGNAAALLGLTEISAEILRNNAALQNPGNRFPAMWGAVHDSVPDTDHGANIMNLLQLMVLQCGSEKIETLPAFPDTWDVKFRLFAPKNTIIEGEFEKGKKVKLDVKSPF